MDEKTEERIALEQKAQDLGVSFAPNIGDEKLAERVKEAEAKAAKAEDTQGAGDVSKDAEAQTEAAETAAATGGGQQTDPAGEAPVITVICLRPDGRRRAGRRWDEGETLVPEGELTAFQIAVLEADPQFIVKREG